MKINITKEELVKLYVDENKTDGQIASLFSTSTFCIWKLRRDYGIEGINARHRILKDCPQLPINKKQMSIIMGSLLGDACLKGKSSCSAYLSVSHTIKQKEYLDWLHNELKTICPTEPKQYSSKEKYITYYFASEARGDLKDIKDKIYTPFKKVNQWWIDQIDDMGLAIWFMDDGCLSYVNKSKSNFSFATNSFSMEENYLLASMLKYKFGLDSEVKPYNKKSGIQFNLFVSDNSFERFSEIISPHIISSMKYKLPCELNKIHLQQNIESRIDKPSLEKLYNVDLLTQEQIARTLNVHKSTVRKYMHLFDIKPRDNINAQINGKNNQCQRSNCGTFLPLSLDNDGEKQARQLFIELRKNSFPYIRIKDDEHYIGVIDKLWNSNVNPSVDGNTFLYSRSGLEICSALCPQIFSMSAKGSIPPTEIFNDDNMLLDCIRRTIKFAKKDTIASVRQGLKTYKKNRCVTIYPPSWAKTIIKNLNQNRNNLSVLDFSCGFGGRLLGSYASGIVSEYTGVDPLSENIESHNKINRLIQKHALLKNVSFKAEFINGRAEDVLDGLSRTFDIILTCPPYFSKEIYSSNESQCYNKYPLYDCWKKEWLEKVLTKSYSLLNPNGMLIIFASNYDKYMVGFDCRDIMRSLSKSEPLLFNFEIPSLEYLRAKKVKKYDSAWVQFKYA